MYYKCFYIFAFLCLYICVLHKEECVCVCIRKCVSVLMRENVCVFMYERERLHVYELVFVCEKMCICDRKRMCLGV